MNNIYTRNVEEIMGAFLVNRFVVMSGFSFFYLPRVQFLWSHLIIYISLISPKSDVSKSALLTYLHDRVCNKIVTKAIVPADAFPDPPSLLE